jgi:tetratricopeptide (TPR) repeat protein
VIMLLRRGDGTDEPQAARHAQVNQQGAVAKIKQQIFAASRDALQNLVGEQLVKPPWQRVAQRRGARNHLRDAASNNVRRDAAAGNFDFGQFGHALGVAALITSTDLYFSLPHSVPILIVFRWMVVVVLAAGSALAVGEDKVAPEANTKSAASLTPNILYQYLLAEVAANRGKISLSAAAYLDLAKTTRDPRIARRATEVAYLTHDPEAALKAARIWAEIDPGSPDARQSLWVLLAGSNHTDELATMLSQVLAGEGQNIASSIIGLGRLASRFPDKQASLRLVMQVTAPYEALPETYFVRAQSAWAARDFDRARASVDRALALRPDWEAAVLLKAQIIGGDLGQALALLSDFVARNPGARDAKTIYARALVDAKRYPEARQTFIDLLAGQPDNPELLYSAGLLSMEMGDYTAGEGYLKQVLDLDFSDMDSVRYYLGHGAELGDRSQDAVAYFDTISTRSPRYVTAQVRAATLLRKNGNLDEARRHLQQAAVAAPKERTPLILAESQLLVESSQVDEAYRLLVAELTAQPSDPALLYESAIVAEKLGKFDVLERNLRRLIKLKPDNAEAYNALGYSMADRNVRLDEAQKLIEKALSLAPTDAAILDSRGWLAFRRNDPGTAIEFLRKALAVNDDPEIAAHLGEVLWAQGHYDDAEKVWESAQKAHPENTVLPATVKRYKP